MPLKNADAENIYLQLIDYLKKRNIQVSKRNTFPTHFVHCYCHNVQLTCVQAANTASSTEHVYITLTTLWKISHYSPKRAESVKEVQKVLDLVKVKIVKPSDTRWLSYEC